MKKKFDLKFLISCIVDVFAGLLILAVVCSLISLSRGTKNDFKTVDTKIVNVDKKIDDTKDILDDFDSKLDDTNDKVNEIDTKLTELESQVATLKQDLAFLGDKVEVSINENEGIDINLSEYLTKEELDLSINRIYETFLSINREFYNNNFSINFSLTDNNDILYYFDFSSRTWDIQLSFRKTYDIVEIPTSYLGYDVVSFVSANKSIPSLTLNNISINKLILPDDWSIFNVGGDNLMIGSIECSESVRDRISWINTSFPDIEIIYRSEEVIEENVEIIVDDDSSIN